MSWVQVNTVDEMQAFYESCIPKIREVARACGYAIGVHGSLRRDLDLIAVPWIEDHKDKDFLAHSIQVACCGMHMAKYEWEAKPCGRFAVSFSVCWTSCEGEFENMISRGHVDLSVMPRIDK